MGEGGTVLCQFHFQKQTNSNKSAVFYNFIVHKHKTITIDIQHCENLIQITIQIFC